MLTSGKAAALPAITPVVRNCGRLPQRRQQLLLQAAAPVALQQHRLGTFFGLLSASPAPAPAAAAPPAPPAPSPPAPSAPLASLPYTDSADQGAATRAPSARRAAWRASLAWWPPGSASSSARRRSVHSASQRAARPSNSSGVLISARLRSAAAQPRDGLQDTHACYMHATCMLLQCVGHTRRATLL